MGVITNQDHRHRIIALVTFIGGLYFFLEYLLPETLLGMKFGRFHDQISTGVTVVGTMAIGLGLINIFRIHGAQVVRRRKGWINSLALLLGFFVMLVVTSIDFVYSLRSVNSWKQVAMLRAFSERIKADHQKNVRDGGPRVTLLLAELDKLRLLFEEKEGYLSKNLDDPTHLPAVKLFEDELLNARSISADLVRAYETKDAESQRTEHSRLEASLSQATEAAMEISAAHYRRTLVQRLSHLLLEGFYNALGTAMFSLLAFYIAYAAYRSFRVRSLEAVVMMAAALIVVLGQIPHGALYIDERLPSLRLWLLKNLSTPAFRTILFGSLIAGLAMAIRMWLSLERSPIAVDEER